MRKVNSRLGFRPRRGRFRLGNLRVRITSRDLKTVDWIARLIEEAGWRSGDPNWLLVHRRRFRQISSERRVVSLLLVLHCSNSDDAQRLAVWLLGRSRRKVGLPVLGQLARTGPVELRREAVKALFRLQGWHYLRHAAAFDPDHRVRRLAQQPAPRDFDERLDSFRPHVSSRPASRVRQLFWSRSSEEAGKPAKPDWYIRQILRRIQQAARRPRSPGL